MPHIVSTKRNKRSTNKSQIAHRRRLIHVRRPRDAMVVEELRRRSERTQSCFLREFMKELRRPRKNGTTRRQSSGGSYSEVLERLRGAKSHVHGCEGY